MSAFFVQTACALRQMLTCGVLGLRHGPRLGAEIGLAAGTVFPIVGNLAGLAVGALAGGPLGFLVGLIGGAINRRWGWALGGALPGLALTAAALVLMRRYSVALNLEQWWYFLCFCLVPAVGGAWAGWRLGNALEASPDPHFDPFRTASERLATTALWARLAVLSVFALPLIDLGWTAIRAGSSRTESAVSRASDPEEEARASSPAARRLR